jgi:hypothetical protein
MNIDRQSSLHIVSVVFIGICVALAGYFIGNGFYQSRMADRYVTVKGLAEKDVKSDLALWTIRFTATNDSLSDAQEKIEADRGTLMNFLKSKGLSDAEVSPGQVNVTDLLAQSYRPEGSTQSRYIITSNVVVRTNKVDLVNEISRGMGEVVRKGVVLADYEGSAGPKYLFTKLNDVKPEMIAEATKNARTAAEKFAADSKSRVGAIRRAAQGQFSITAPDDPEGMTDYTHIDKRVRVVSTIDYYLAK